MRIETEAKLDYSDVLIRPKRSTLGSRKEVDLERGFKFRNYQPEDSIGKDKKHWRGIPIMAANMDGVGTFEMADTLARQKMFTCLVKTYDVMELVQFFDDPDKPQRKEYVAYSMGITDADHDKFRRVYEEAPEIKFVCIDVGTVSSRNFLI